MLLMARSQLFRGLTMALLVAACVSAIARGRDDVWNASDGNPVWRSECGVCHMAYPPSLLASEDWLSIMVQLDRHFGVDASLDPSANSEIADYLKRNGADGWPSVGHDALPRITTTARFEGKHRSAIRLWRKGQLKSLSDCGACHKEAGSQR
jgi:hypothetical protein